MGAADAAIRKMREAGVAEPAITTFARQLERVRDGATGTLPDAEIEPVDAVPALDELPDAAGDGATRDALDRTVVLKLNGGLGTSMGMTGPKSLVEAKDGLTFLDVVVRQTLALRERHGVRLPLVLMNSFSTREATLEAMAGHPGLQAGVPLDFPQDREPKLRAEDVQPVEWPPDPRLEWCPPGHGDLYTALLASLMLEALRAAGYRHLFASNVDNLGAVLDPRILAHVAAQRIP